jgi:hypothetical protein
MPTPQLCEKIEINDQEVSVFSGSSLRQFQQSRKKPAIAAEVRNLTSRVVGGISLGNAWKAKSFVLYRILSVLDSSVAISTLRNVLEKETEICNLKLMLSKV